MKRSGAHDAKHDTVYLAVIISLGLLLRFTAIIAYDHTPSSDELAYKSMALNLISGNGIVDNMGNHAMYSVGYPLFILSPVFAIFGENIFLARAVNALLGGLAIFLCYAVAKEAGAGRFGRCLAALLWAVYLPASIYAVYLAKENLMIPIMLGAFWCVLRIVKAPSYGSAMGCGLFFGLLALVGNAALSLSATAVLALALAPTTFNNKIRYSFAILLCAVLIPLSWMMRNLQVLGAPVINTNGGFNLYIGNNPAATGMFVSIGDTPRGSTWGALREEGEVRASEILKAEAISWIKENPSSFLALSLKKAIYFWTPPIHEGKGPSSRTDGLVRILWAIQFFLLIAGAATTVILKRLRNPAVALMWVAVAGYTAVHMLFYVIFRYRLAVMPILCVMTALSVETLFLSRYSKEWVSNSFEPTVQRTD